MRRSTNPVHRWTGTGSSGGLAAAMVVVLSSVGAASEHSIGQIDRIEPLGDPHYVHIVNDDHRDGRLIEGQAFLHAGDTISARNANVMYRICGERGARNFLAGDSPDTTVALTCERERSRGSVHGGPHIVYWLDPDELIGIEVVARDNTLIGTVADLMLTEDGDVESVVIGVGGFLGIGAREVALDIGQFESPSGTAVEPQLKIGLTREVLEAMPEFNAADYAIERFRIMEQRQ